MFGNNNGKDAKTTSSSTSSSSSNSGSGGVNTIDKNTKLEGNITANGNIRIDGTLIGNLKCEALLVIGPKGNIEGDVTCVKAIIEGRFKGNLIVKEDLTLQATSKIYGDVKAKKMAVLGGAEIKCTCTVPHTGGGNGNNGAHKKQGNPLKQKQGVNA
ncbi:MAG: polymer-forming cytoskeletal protein [Bacteroidota bacterium]